MRLRATAASTSPSRYIHTRVNYVIICVKARCRDANKMRGCVFCECRVDVCIAHCIMRQRAKRKFCRADLPTGIPPPPSRLPPLSRHSRAAIEGEVRQSGGPPRYRSERFNGTAN